jgi:hypothetical protein
MTKKFYRAIIFSKTPLTTYLRVGNYFQIYPCDFTNAPKSRYCHDFPLVIEYWVDEDEKIEISDDWEDLKDYVSKSSLQIIKLNRLTRLLSAITNHRFFSYGESEFKWGVALPDKELGGDEKDKINNTPSQAILGVYTYPDMWKDLQLKDFSEQRHPSSKLVRHVFYYIHDPIDNKTKEIKFPATIQQLVDEYFKLDAKTTKIVNSITHLICNGVDIKSKMKSLSFLSFVSAVETIVNFEFKDKNDEIEFECTDCQTVNKSPLTCPKCGRPLWGVKAKFKAFLKTYVSNGDGSIKKYNRIYNLRSDIVHNGMLLLGDEQFYWAKSDKADSQYMTHLETMQLARLSLVNWLLMGPNKELVE